MPLSAGSKLGPYEVLSRLGAGGMGEVYLARDLRLKREVAIKVLPAERMADESRRRRFVQEAQSASALNHPNIITIHEIDSIDGIDFIVMEYVRGKSLATLIPRPGMRLKDVLRIAIPIADALARAHAAGIVHRDLKPANVMVGSDGAAKVLDFGLAKLVTFEPGSAHHETVSEDDDALSRPGTIVGTAGYMSPEQAMGKEVDARSDVFSFGSVLYEMVTGQRAFSGNSRVETLAAVVRDQPKLPSDIVPSVPRDIERVIQRCLRKEPERRFQHMLDVKLELEQIREDSASQAAPAPVAARWSRRGLMTAVTVAIVLVLGTTAWRLWRPTVAVLPPLQVVPLTTMRGEENAPTFSPEGERVAFSWNEEEGKDNNAEIYVKQIGTSERQRLTTNPPNYWPSWSPDGRQIAFVHAAVGPGPSTIHLVSPLGGSYRKLSDLPVDGYSQLSWSPDGRWLAAAHPRSQSGTKPDDGGIFLIPSQFGEPRLLMRAPPSGANGFPAFSPEGRRLAYTEYHAGSGCAIYLVELDSDFVPTSPPRRLTRQGGRISSLAWARDGASIVYAAEQGPDTEYLWRVAVQGDRPPERIEVAGHKAMELAIAPVGHRLAFSSSLFDSDICRFEPGHPAHVFLGSSFADDSPRFSPDGQRIAFHSFRSGERHEIWLAGADGSNPRPLMPDSERSQGAPDWSPDGRRIAFHSLDGLPHIWTIDVESGTPRRLTQDPGGEWWPSWSRDGRWVYFFSERDGGVPEVWRAPATGGVEERITHGGADFNSQALESSDGKALFFRRRATGGTLDGSLLALPLSGGQERTLVASMWTFTLAGDGVYYAEGGSADPMLHRLEPLTGQDQTLGKLERFYGQIAVSPDGKTILYTKVVSEGSDLMVIENFR